MRSSFAELLTPLTELQSLPFYDVLKSIGLFFGRLVPYRVPQRVTPSTLHGGDVRLGTSSLRRVPIQVAEWSEAKVQGCGTKTRGEKATSVHPTRTFDTRRQTSSPTHASKAKWHPTP